MRKKNKPQLAHRQTMNRHQIALGVTHILQGLNVDLKDPNFKRTPERVAKMYEEVLKPPKFGWSKFPSSGFSEMVVMHGHKVFSFCPHHLLPVEMKISIGYIPRSKGYIAGLSKVPRLADKIARRLVLQEVISVDIVDAMMKNLKLLGCGCIVIARHMCLAMRGVETEGLVTTSALRGVFLEKPAVRQEFFNLVLK